MRMKTFTKAVALFVVMALMMVMTISAATVTNVDVSIDSTGTVTITAMHPEGAAGAGKTVTVVVTNGTADVYWNDAVADENGKVEFTFAMDPAVASGTYGVELGGAGLEPNLAGDAETGDTFVYANATGAAAFIGAINLLDATALQDYLEGRGHTDDFDGDANYATHFGVNCAAGSDYAAASNKTAIIAAVDDVYIADQASQDVAWEFIKYYYNTESQNICAKYRKGGFPIKKSAYENMGETKPANIKGIVEGIDQRGHTLSEGPGWKEWRTIAEKAYKDYVSDKPTKPLDQILADVQTDVQRVLDEANAKIAQ